MDETLDPNKFHVLDESKKRLLFIIGGVLLIVLLPIFSFFYYNFAINRPSQTVDEHTIEIEPGWSISTISKELYTKDVINSRALFIFYILVNNLEQDIQAGEYMIPPGVSLKELSDMLQYGTKDVRITFLEGWRVEQFALAATEKFEDVDYEDFVERARDSEGYLFPDTYVFPHDITTQEIIDHLKDTFDSKTAELLNEDALEKVGLSKEEVIIMASIVEREVADPLDRALVAGVLLKRYRNGMPLGADATVQYYAPFLRIGCSLESENICPTDDRAKEIDWWPYSLTQAELDYDSPYNTRKYEGLPPSPISSVSLSAIESVLNYKESENLYYLTDPEGVTHFAQTLEEHERNIALYLR